MYKREDLLYLLKKLQKSVGIFFDNSSQAMSFPSLYAYCVEHVPELNIDTHQKHQTVRSWENRLIVGANTAVQRILVTCDPLEKLVIAEKMDILKKLIQEPVPFHSLEGMHITVLGAGVTGLTAAYALALRGAKVTIFEKRGSSGRHGIEPAVVERGQNVSWTGFEKVLQPLFGEQAFQQIYQDMFANGAVIASNSKKLRSSIGAYQEVFISALQKLDVCIQYGVKINSEQIQTLSGTDLICVASGIKAHEEYPNEAFTIESFPGVTCRVQTALAMYPADDKAKGFYRVDRQEGIENDKNQTLSWRIKNENVQDRTAFATEVVRYIANLEKLQSKLGISKERITLIKNRLAKASHIAHVFYFGKDSPHFLSDIPVDSKEYPLLQMSVEVPLWMMNRSMVKNQHKIPIFYLGDASGSTNPLAAMGNHLCMKNARDITRLAEGLQQIKLMRASSLTNIIDDLLKNIQECLLEMCNGYLTQDRLAIFLQAYLCYLYSFSDAEADSSNADCNLMRRQALHR